MSNVTIERARRVAVRAQLLDGSARGVLQTVRRLGFLQIDPIATVAPPQQLVLWSRLGVYPTAELERLLWTERKLFEWNAFIWPIETLPYLRARMRRYGRNATTAGEHYVKQFLATNASFRRYILSELGRRGPCLSRELEDRSRESRGNHRWFGSRYVTRMLEILHLRGEVAVAGRSGQQRLWDLAERWYPETDAVPLREANRQLDEQRFRALGVRWTSRGGFDFHPGVSDEPVPDRVTLLSPFDRLIHDRARTETLFGFRYRLEMYVPAARREYGYYVLPLLVGDRLVGRAEPRYDRAEGTLRVLGAWGDTARLPEAVAGLQEFLEAQAVPRTG
ncbi:MAG: winged helix-turn-helix domain-containing protein [Actinobacteria bacterium]|nr:winged helix-turn-helix domain-containing protein [Actinomycetota bacterium]